MNEWDLGVILGLYLLCWSMGYAFGVGLYTVRKVLEGSGSGL